MTVPPRFVAELMICLQDIETCQRSTDLLTKRFNERHRTSVVKFEDHPLREIVLMSSGANGRNVSQRILFPSSLPEDRLLEALGVLTEVSGEGKVMSRVAKKTAA